MSGDLHTELAARMPWLHAQPDSMWEVTGRQSSGGQFTDCLARVLPPSITGTDVPVFEVLIYGGGYCVSASAITRARELLLVEASDPRTAYYVRDQATLDGAA